MLYVGIDVGGTKIQASRVEESGTVVGRQRVATPREGGAEAVLAAIDGVVDDVLDSGGEESVTPAAIGVAIPGVVDPSAARVVVTPNMNLTGVEIGAHLEKRFRVPVAVGNDCNLGTLGERWLGSARRAGSAMGIFVGTGIGGGFVRKGKLWRGARETAGEVGHMIMEVGGPECGCGNRGCLEALASRAAVERRLRAAIDAGESTILTDLLDDLSVIRSSAIRKALDQQDPLVTREMHRAAELLGYACVSIRHLLDPEVIILGGGVVEACSRFIMPIVERVVAADRLPGARETGGVLLSTLGDDAVVLGAVALARQTVGRSPFKRRYAVSPEYPSLEAVRPGVVRVGGRTFDRDVYVFASGKVRKRKRRHYDPATASAHRVGPREIERLCAGGPEVVFVAAGQGGQVELSDEATRFLERRAIDLTSLPTAEAVEAFNRCKQRKAALIHVSC